MNIGWYYYLYQERRPIEIQPESCVCNRASAVNSSKDFEGIYFLRRVTSFGAQVTCLYTRQSLKSDQERVIETPSIYEKNKLLALLQLSHNILTKVVSGLSLHKDVIIKVMNYGMFSLNLNHLGSAFSHLPSILHQGFAYLSMFLDSFSTTC
jgi:hypothetical protein